MENITTAYADYLKSYNWDYFLTVTFRSARRMPYYALKGVWSALEGCGAARAFLGAEPHKSGDLHIHGIISGSGGDWEPQIALPWDIQDTMHRRFGRSRVQACNSQEAVSGYCSKYVVKAQSHVADHYNFFGNKMWWGH